MIIHWVGTLPWMHSMGHYVYIHHESLSKITNFVNIVKPYKQINQCSATVLLLYLDWLLRDVIGIKHYPDCCCQFCFMTSATVKGSMIWLVCFGEKRIQPNGPASRIHAIGKHYSNVKMREVASQITGISIVSSIVCSGVDQRKHQSICEGKLSVTVDFHQKGTVTRKMFSFDDVIMNGFGITLSEE